MPFLNRAFPIFGDTSKNLLDLVVKDLKSALSSSIYYSNRDKIHGELTRIIEYLVNVQNKNLKDLNEIRETIDKLKDVANDIKRCRDIMGDTTSYMKVDYLKTPQYHLEVAQEDIREAIKILEKRRKKVTYKQGEYSLDRLVEDWWNGTGGIKLELEESMKLLNESLKYCHYVNDKYGSDVSPKFINYLESLRTSQQKFLKALDNFIITTHDEKSFLSNFEPIIRKFNFTDLLNSQKEFLEQVVFFDSISKSEIARLISKSREKYSFFQLYDNIKKLSDIYKRTRKFIKNVDLQALMIKSTKMVEGEKIIPK